MFSKKLFPVLCCIAIFIVAIIIHGCSRTTSTSSSGNYTIAGKVSNLSVGTSMTTSSSNTVTNIVAIDSNNQKTQATIGSDGTFSIGVDSGYPVILGFYNKTGTAITLLGYLKQNDVDWDSLPLMNPSDTSINLGTIEVDTTSQEATPSIDLTSLISEMNMIDQTNAAYYGQIDDPMTVLTNLDVDGNGVFDFEENKSFLFWADLGFSTSAQLNNMLNQFASSYTPAISYYTYQFIFDIGTSAVAGTAATMSAPGGLSGQSLTGEAASNRDEWVFSFGSNITTPSVPPGGTYSIAVTGVGNYTFNNFQSAQISYVGATENVIYPILKLTVDGNGYVTRVDYQWKVIKNAAARDATSDELKTIEDTALTPSKGFSHGSPFIHFWFSDGTMNTPLAIPRDLGYLAIDTVVMDSTSASSRRVLFSDLTSVSLTYNLTSRTVHRFWFN